MLRVRHTSAADIGGAVVTTVSVGLPNGASRTDGVFRTVTSAPDTIPDDFDFGMIEDVPGDTLIESPVRGADRVQPAGADQVRPARRSTGSTAAPGPTPTGMLQPEQTLQLRHVSNGPAHSVRTTHIKVGET